MNAVNTQPEPHAVRPSFRLVPAVDMPSDPEESTALPPDGWVDYDEEPTPQSTLSDDQLRDGLLNKFRTDGINAVSALFCDVRDGYRDERSQEIWSPLVPLRLASALPAFPLQALPSALRDYVTEVAATRQVPVDLPAMLALATVAACGARRFEVQVGSSQIEPINLWVICGAEPGERKSAVFRDMVSPLREWERQLGAEAEAAIISAQHLRDVQETRLKNLKAMAAKAKADDERRLLEEDVAAAACSLPVVPSLPRLLVDDVTPERLASLMAQNDGCMALMSPEGGVFGMMAGRYNQHGGPNLDVYLKGHAGDALRVDRADGRQSYVTRAMLTMGLAVQPGVIRDLSKDKAFRYRGLLGRGLYSLPVSLMGSRMSQDRAIDRRAREQYEEAIGRILSVPAILDEEGLPGRHRLILEREALLVHWPRHDAIERALGPDGPLSGIKDWAAKLAGQVARIAAGFHLVAGWCQPHEELRISAEEIEAAWQVADYLVAHALETFVLMAEPVEYGQAQRIVDWIKRKARMKFSRADLWQDVRHSGWVEKPFQLDAPLDVLERHNYIAAEEQRHHGPGRPRTTAYGVNPAVLRTDSD